MKKILLLLCVTASLGLSAQKSENPQGLNTPTPNEQFGGRMERPACAQGGEMRGRGRHQRDCFESREKGC